MSDFSYPTVNRQFSFSFPNIRSISPRFLYFSLSYTISSFQFLRPSIIAVLLFPSNSRQNSLLSYPRSPITAHPITFSTSSTATFTSCTAPPVKSLSTASYRSLSLHETSYLSLLGSSLSSAASFLSSSMPEDFHRRTVYYHLVKCYSLLLREA